MAVWVEIDLCDGCQRCLRACPYDAVALSDGKAIIGDRCTSCGACITTCRTEAIQTDIEPRKVPDFSDHQGIWVFAEQHEGELNRVSLELLGKARQLGQALNQEVSAILIGHQVEGFATTLIQHGADNVFLVEDNDLKDYQTLTYTAVIDELVRLYKPNIFLLGATLNGRDLAPRVSRRIGAGLTADCTALDIDPDERILLQTRPAFGGNVMATIANRFSRPQMATVRPGVMEVCPMPDHQGTVIQHTPNLENVIVGTKILAIVKEAKPPCQLADAKVIVACGRGIGDTAGMRVLRELADALNAEIAGTRVAVEQGWIGAENQVGQTGLTVRPDLYIACGVSGAIQHRAGMMDSKFIVAVNKDPRAPIFQIADWGIVGDIFDVIPAITRQLVDIRESQGVTCEVDT